MRHSLPLKLTSIVLLCAFWALPGGGVAHAQDASIGGPYEVDENTVVLMHFDGDYANASNSTADGSAEGDVSFTEETPQSGFGQSAVFDNTEQKSVVTIPDTAALDLTGDWTIEAWARTSFATSGPRLVMKPGDPFWQTNYYMAIEDRGGGNADRGFRTGYRAQGNQFSPNGLIEDDQWYHYTYIRDAEQQQLIQVIRDADLNLVFYGVYDFSATPGTTDQPLHIGGAPSNDFLRLTGNLDEVRVSNVVRTELIPDANAAQASVRSGQTGTILDTLGTQVSFSTGSGSDGLFFGTRLNHLPDNQTLIADSSARADDGSEVAPERLVGETFWVLDHRNLSDFEAKICLSAEDVQNLGQDERLLVVTRNDAGTSWAPLNTDREMIDGTSHVCADGRTAFSQYAIAVGTADESTQLIGGPYEVDENTIVLMHFEGDYANASDSTADGQVQGDASMVGFQSSSASGVLGQSIQFENNAEGDPNYVAVSDTAALNLTGDWTIEAWGRVDEYYASNNQPRLLFKTGDPAFHNNYYIANEGDTRLAKGGYHYGSGFNNTETDGGVIEAGQWYHYAFIRDTTKGQTAILVHDADRNLIAAGSAPIGEGTPTVTDLPLAIGVHPTNDSRRLNGAMDEVRISNVVRNFGAPLISNVTDPTDNQTPFVAPGEGPYEVSADVTVAGTGSISDVTLHYRAGYAGSFQEVAMTTTNDTTYTGEIPDQEEGTPVSYYLSTTLEDGTRITSPSTAEDAEHPNRHGFGVSDPESRPNRLVLDLDFEDGELGTSTPPEDNSALGHQVQVFGNPTYTDAAIRGGQALALDGGTDGDADYLKVDNPAPFLASEEFTLDFWFNASSVETGDRYVLKQGGEGVTGRLFHDNYKVFLFQDPPGIRGASFQKGGGLNGGNLDPGFTPETDTWYRATYYMAQDTAYFQVRDSSMNVVAEAGYVSDDLPATATRGPVFIGFGTEPGSDPVEGRVDNVRIYNYPASGEVLSPPPEIVSVTQYDSVRQVGGGNPPVEAEVEPGDEDVESVTLHYDSEGDGSFESTAMLARTDTTFRGTIPAPEEVGVVRYYVTAEDVGGRQSFAPEGAETGDDHYRLYFGEERTKVLHLAFEEGQGAPVDRSAYDHEVQMLGLQGQPQYSDDAAVGDYAIQFAENDSSYLEVEEPALFLAAEEFTLDFWFKVETLNEARMVIKEGGHGVTNSWFEPNYQVFPINAVSEDSIEIRAASAMQSRTGFQNNGSDVETPRGTQLGEWYRAIYKVSEDTIFFQIRDSEGEVFDENGYDEEPTEDGPGVAEPTQGPFRVAAASNNRFFYGKIDALRLWNYDVPLDQVITDTEGPEQLPTEYELSENYPNPFTRSTTIEYALPQATEVTLSVYDLLGRKVATLAAGKKQAGRHVATFEGSSLPSGIYFYRMETESTSVVRKMTVVR